MIPIAAPAGQAPVLGGGAAGLVAVPADYDGPPAPLPPAVIARDATATRATIRAVRLLSPLRIDGHLDETVYQEVRAVSDFVQQEPQEGMPATERTDVWVFFDQDSLYLAALCWDSSPDRMIATEMRRDGSRVPRNENLAFTLDTFFDHRNGYYFEQTPAGGVMDGQIANDGATFDGNWNGVWERASARLDRGWAVEARIPFKTLRYRPSDVQIWALQVRRLVRWKNEISYITRIPRSIGERGHMRLSLAPAIVGLEVPPPAKHFEIKPYVVSSLSTDRTVSPRISNQADADWGGDVKYGLTKSLTADFTYNTDFAQVEADQQQINLTRFSLNFPEKRDFFLENSGTFTFANATGTDSTPAMFYSRRIGLAGSRSVPLIAGGRVSGRVGKFTVGALDIQSDTLDPATALGAGGASVPSTNFSVVRLKRDILRRSYVGALVTGRSVGQNGTGSNQAYGIDAAFNLKTNLTLTAFFARTHGAGRTPGNSYKGSLAYEGDRYGTTLEYLTVGPTFNPEVGFVRRLDIDRAYGQFRFSPRPADRSSGVRKYYYIGTIERIATTGGQLQNTTSTAELAIDLQNSDRASLRFSEFYEYLPTSVPLGRGVAVPIGAYRYRSLLAGYNFGPQRKWVSTNSALEYGTFYGGHKTSINVSGGAVSWPPHLVVEPTYTLNYIVLPPGVLNQNLIGPRINYGLTPKAFVSALVQYNTTINALSSNIRLRWEYRPGSELFIVWNQQHDTLAGGLPVQNRAFVVKFNRLFRF